MTNPLGAIIRFIFKVALALFAAVFVVSLFLAALVVVVLSLIMALVTGRKPTPAMVFSRFQKYSPQGMWPTRPGTKETPPGTGTVVDVEAREVKDDKSQL